MTRRPNPPHSKKSSLFLKVASIILLPVLLFFSLQFFLGLLFLPFKSFLPLTSPLFNTLTFLFVFSTLLFLLIRFLPRFYPKLATNREELGLLGLPTWTDLLLTLPAFVLHIIISLVLTAIFSLLPFFNPNQPQNLGYGYFIDFFDFFCTFLGLVILPPFCEEVLFRGWIYGKLRAKINLPLAIFLTSLTFAILHGQLNVGLNVFAMSIVACLTREFTGTIWSSIFFHMLKNGLAFYLLYILHVTL